MAHLSHHHAYSGKHVYSRGKSTPLRNKHFLSLDATEKNNLLCWTFKRLTEAATRCSLRKDVLINFVKFTGKHLRQRLFLNKVACLRPEACNLIKKVSGRIVFPMNFAKFLRIPFFAENLWATASGLTLFAIQTS